jgi:ankyrin repeat protein
MNIKDTDKLFEEVKKGNLQYVKDYVNDGGDINVKCENDEEWTIAHVAALYYNLDLIKYYIEHGGDINARTDIGRTIRDVASKIDFLDCLNYFNELIDKDKQ